MKTRITLALVVVTCLLAVAPASAAAASDKVNASVRVALEAAGPGEAVPVFVVAPGRLAAVRAQLPAGVTAEALPIAGAVAAWLTEDEIEALARRAYVAEILADNPVYGIGVADSAMDVTNIAIGLGELDAPEDGGPAGAGVTVAILDSGIGVNTDLPESRIVGWVDLVKGKRATVAATPWKFEHGDACPVRMIAMLDPSGKLHVEAGN